MSTPGRFADRRVAVVGAAGGIGRSVCERMTAEGACVLGIDVDAPGLDALVDKGWIAESLALDLTAANAAPKFEDWLARGEQLDVLINTQGITHEADVEVAALDDAVYDKVVALNLTSVMRMCRAAIPYLVAAQSASIVNVSSTASVRATGGTAYVISKAGVNALTSALAYQLAAHNVRCNAVILGPVDTKMLAISTAKLGDRITATAPGVLAGIPSAEEAAGLIAFLASDEARHVTGSQYRLDGGRIR